MHKDPTANNIVLATTAGLGEISMCGCGVISLHLGSVSIRLEGTALLRVEQMIQTALGTMCHLAARHQERPGHAQPVQ